MCVCVCVRVCLKQIRNTQSLKSNFFKISKEIIHDTFRWHAAPLTRKDDDSGE